MDIRISIKVEKKTLVYTCRPLTFATGPITLFTLSDTIFFHFVVVWTTGPDTGAMICHHIVS